MDVYERKIKQGLQDVAGIYGPAIIIAVTVNSVDTTAFTCDCETDDEIKIPGVLYKNFSDGNIDLVLEPAVNSRIWIGRIEDSEEWIMIKPGILNKVQIKVGNYELDITQTGIVINGGKNGGLVKLTGLVDKLNVLENSLTALKNILSTWVPVTGDGGAALKTAITTWAATAINETVSADLENKQITQ